jgi:DNA polymerase-3 subunit delta'
MSISHNKQWNFLKEKFESGQLSHSYLISGNQNIGKLDFVKRFCDFMGCKFPDLMVVDIKEEIKIEKIREIQDFLSYKAYNGGFKSVVVANADQMNIEAQNCFLKTLEEPKGQTLIFLISSKPDLLLDTIRSRCQQIKFFGKAEETQEEIKRGEEILGHILKVSGADMAVKFQYAKSVDFEEISLQEILIVLEKYSRYLVFKKAIGDQKGYFANIKSPMESYSVEKLRNIIELIEEINTKATFTNINQKLALENLLLEI